MEVSQSKNGVTLVAYQGDAMTLLAFDLIESKSVNFTGFSINVTPNGAASFYLDNLLCYPEAIRTKNNITEQQARSTLFSPIQKFRWVHVPSTFHNVSNTIYGDYTYSITPRYLVDGVLQPLDATLTATVTINVCPFRDNGLQIGFTRGFVASQACKHNFGDTLKLRPDAKVLLFDTKQQSGSVTKEVHGAPVVSNYTYDDMFAWLGWQARQRVMEFLNETLADQALSLDVFAFDLNEPDICTALLTLAGQGRLRIILDDSRSHKEDRAGGVPSYENQFEAEFNNKKTAGSDIYRGHFSSLSHSKIFIQKDAAGKPVKVLTGSTNFSTNGLYVNANHILIFNSPVVAQIYAEIFEASFGDVNMHSFKHSADAETVFKFNVPGDTDSITADGMPQMTICFSPHPVDFATKELTDMGNEVTGAKSNLLFAIMDDHSHSPLLEAVLKQITNQDIFVYGITDKVSSKEEADKVQLYKPGSKTGLHVAGNQLRALPPPFEKEPPIRGISIHHKFVVVDFNTNHGVVYCGSSNLALGPEQANGDNLIAIRDRDVVTAFAIEAIRLVDHFAFRNKQINSEAGNDVLALKADSRWVSHYYDSTDLLCMERALLVS